MIAELENYLESGKGPIPKPTTPLLAMYGGTGPPLPSAMPGIGGPPPPLLPSGGPPLLFPHMTFR